MVIVNRERRRSLRWPALIWGVGMAADPVADIKAVFDILETRIAWHCVCAVTRLDVPDRLAGGPFAVPQLAAAVGAHEDSLRRVLRLLSDHGSTQPLQRSACKTSPMP